MKLPRPPTSDVIINNRSAFSQPALQSLVHTHEHRSRHRSYTVARQGIHTRTARVVRQASSGPQTHTHTHTKREKREKKMSATCVGIRAPLALRARAKGGVKGSRTVRVLAKASAAEDVKGCKVGLAALAVRLPTVPPEDAPTTYPTSIRARLQPPRLTHTLPHPALPNPTGGSRDTPGAGIRRGGVRRCAERRDRRASGALGPRRRG